MNPWLFGRSLVAKAARDWRFIAAHDKRLYREHHELHKGLLPYLPLITSKVGICTFAMLTSVWHEQREQS